MSLIGARAHLFAAVVGRLVDRHSLMSIVVGEIIVTLGIAEHTQSDQCFTLGPLMSNRSAKLKRLVKLRPSQVVLTQGSDNRSQMTQREACHNQLARRE